MMEIFRAVGPKIIYCICIHQFFALTTGIARNQSNTVNNFEMSMGPVPQCARLALPASHRMGCQQLGICGGRYGKISPFSHDVVSARSSPQRNAVSLLLAGSLFSITFVMIRDHQAPMLPITAIICRGYHN
jgi:hypothetical protein